MEPISVFDMFKIGVGPSSSHTLGPWRATRAFIAELRDKQILERCARVEVHLYGSLALTGHGHGTDLAVQLGLLDTDPESIPIERVTQLPRQIKADRLLALGGTQYLTFDPQRDLHFHYDLALPEHANGMRLIVYGVDMEPLHEGTYFSIGGGFFIKAGEADGSRHRSQPPFPIQHASDLRRYCAEENAAIWELVLANEQAWHTPRQVGEGLRHIWRVMEACLYRGCHTGGELPGGLRVSRRAAGMMRGLLGARQTYQDAAGWIACLRHRPLSFQQTLKCVSCFAMAVNEENANFGRVVTSPTNGSAGVIPAVLMYYRCFTDHAVSDDDVVKFLLTAGVVGSIFKQNATISAAMGGCQAEIGVSSAMAAAALTEGLGGTVGQALMAAEIAMEHHLGLTCDPIGGLVQVPCIERNSMGAIKAITAANIALESDPANAKVSLDAVIKTMWETAQDMNLKYKETSQGGLAVNIAINVPEC